MEENKKKISLIQIDRFSAWVLLLSIITYMLSGYGMTRGIFNSQLARTMHRNILPIITMVAFVGHTSLAVRVAMMRKRIWNKFTKILLILAYVIGFSFFIYLEIFIMRDGKNTVKTTPVSQKTKTVTGSEEKITEIEESENEKIEQKVFTLEELSQYDGKGGQN